MDKYIYIYIYIYIRIHTYTYIMYIYHIYMVYDTVTFRLEHNKNTLPMFFVSFLKQSQQSLSSNHPNANKFLKHWIEII